MYFIFKCRYTALLMKLFVKIFFVMIRLSKVLRELNVGIDHVIAFLSSKGHSIKKDPNAKLTEEQYKILIDHYSSDKKLKLKKDEI